MEATETKDIVYHRSILLQQGKKIKSTKTGGIKFSSTTAETLLENDVDMDGLCGT